MSELGIFYPNMPSEEDYPVYEGTVNDIFGGAEVPEDIMEKLYNGEILIQVIIASESQVSESVILTSSIPVGESHEVFIQAEERWLQMVYIIKYIDIYNPSTQKTTFSYESRVCYSIDTGESVINDVTDGDFPASKICTTTFIKNPFWDL